MRLQFKIRTLLASCAFFAIYLSAYLCLRDPVSIIERSAGSNVSQSAAKEYQRVSPETEFFGISNTGEKYSRPR